MRSIPLAMIWEFGRRGKLMFPAAFLGALALPGMVFGALQLDGALDPWEPGLIPIFTTFTLINGMVLGSAVMHAFGTPARFYALPVATATLVVWHLLPGMAAMVVMSAATTALLNAGLGLDLPLWGPALFLAVALAATQAILWLTGKSVWSLFAFAAVAVAMAIWYQTRHGAAFSPPTRLWREVTPGEVMTMLAATVLAIYGACVAIARDRCGEALTSPWLRAWFERVFDTAPAVGLPFQTPAQAQFWFEWRQKGPVLPAAVVMGLVAGSGCWLIFSRNSKDLLEGLVAGGAMLSLLGLIIGLVMGNTGPVDTNFAMGQFLGTRPLSNPELARPILQTALRGVALAWVIWAAAFLAVYGILRTIGVEPHLPPGVRWWYFPATLLGLWTSVTVLTCLGLTGRSTPILSLLIGGLSTFVAILIFSKFALSPEGQTMLFHGLRSTFGVACVVGTAAAYMAALRRALIGAPTAGLAGALWCALCMLVVVERMMGPARPLHVYVLAAGLLALAVLPPAAAPLAIAWNRQR
jgi:hypothetical protein